nr:hypothetical protein [Streptococcus lutetiensis]
MSKLIATSHLTLMNLTEKAIERTKVTFWHGLSATKHPLGVYDCGSRDHAFANEFDVVSGKKYTVRIIAQRTKGAINLKGGIWYTERTSGYQFDGLAALTQVGELSEDGLGIWERTLTVPNGKIKGRAYVQLEQSSASGFSTAYRVYDAQVFDENEQPLVTDQNNFGALTSPMAAPGGTYIWKRTITYYTDGTNDTVWEYSGVGEKGNTGANGQTSHVHFAFADNATGGGFSLTTPKAYMGWYADFNESASNDPTKYRWSKWKGDQGAPGKPGADGKTSYFHMAYAESADGRTGFSFKESGQQYQGYYTDFTQTSSTDPSKYTWMDRRAGVKVGGKNLLLHTADPWKAPNDYYQFSGVTKTDEMLNGSVVYKTRSIWSRLGMNWGKQLIDRPDVKIGDEFTYSVYVRTDQETPIKARLFFRYSGQSNAEDMTGEKLITQEWQRFTKTFTVTQKMLSDSSKLSWVGFEQTTNSEDGKFVYYACNMLEEGNVPTPWTQALEDIQSDIDSKADQTLTQEQLNALEAKRLQMETEMKALATLQQVSELETLINNLKKEDLDGRQKIIEITKAIEERVKDIEPIMEYSQKLKFMDTYITQGNGGMIIGANDSTTKVVVTPDRISFQSGGSEVAYISQRMLHIDNGVFTMSLQLGHYITRAHPKNEYVNATYFVK